MTLSKPNPKAPQVKCCFTLPLPPWLLNVSRHLGFGNRRLKTSVSDGWWVHRPCFSPYAVVTRRGERADPSVFEALRKTQSPLLWTTHKAACCTKVLYSSRTDRLKWHLNGLKCFQESFRDSQKNHIFLCPNSFNSPWIYILKLFLL